MSGLVLIGISACVLSMDWYYCGHNE